MTEFLVRRFVKDYTQTDNIQVRTDYGILSSFVGIFCNVLLFAAKFLIGFVMGSIAVMADAFNNLSDAASSIISFIGVKMAGKPADKDHPFGHGRIEYIAALIVAFLVIQVGFSFFKSGIDKFRNPAEIRFELIPFLILLLSIGVKLWMASFNRKLGRRIDSKVMLATAADSMGDVITTSATVLSILICEFVGVNIDAAAGIAVSLVVMWSGVSIARDTLEPLIGEPVDPQLYQDITECVESYDGILGTHDLIVHNYGPGRSMASIHAEVPREVDVATSHEIIDRAEREVSKSLGIFLVIHMDPVEVNNQEMDYLKEQLTSLLSDLDSKLSFHDFRMVNGKEEANLIFDLVVPFDYTEKGIDGLKARIAGEMHTQKKYPGKKYRCVMTVDRNFLGE